MILAKDFTDILCLVRKALISMFWASSMGADLPGCPSPIFSTLPFVYPPILVGRDFNIFDRDRAYGVKDTRS